MAYFHCLIGGGSGGGYELTVTCDADFAGTTITCTDGVTTLTQTCPSASPYEVVFEIPNGGTWTVSGIVSGSTCTASIDIPDELELIAIPDGSTVTPTDVIQTWLKCGGIFDKSYTTLNEVLADSTTLLALMSDNNAVDYLVRSTTWASGITADSTAMTDIGANNYCANTLLSDSTWLNAICNSTYFESVLNVKVPTMTSNTTPSGVVSASSVSSNPYHPAWYAFDNTAKTSTTEHGWSTEGTGAIPAWLQYEFVSSVIINRVDVRPYNNTFANSKNFKIQASNDGFSSDINDLYTGQFSNDATTSKPCITIAFANDTSYKYYRVYIIDTWGTQWIGLSYVQFYGRADV